MEPVLIIPIMMGAVILIFLFYKLIILKKKKSYEKKDKSGVCMVCGHNVQNLGGHIDFCIDSQIWKVK